MVRNWPHDRRSTPTPKIFLVMTVANTIFAFAWLGLAIAEPDFWRYLFVVAWTCLAVFAFARWRRELKRQDDSGVK